MEINKDTKLVTLIGKPLGQSFAARMQNRAYEVMGLNMHYSYTEADQRDLGRIVSEIRAVRLKYSVPSGRSARW